MVEPPAPPTRERLIEAAAELFAARGYAGTSVADIQRASGLTGGSGALYKHFPSKRALLAACVQRHITTMTTTRAEFDQQLPDDPRATLRLMVTKTWAAMDRDRRFLRVLLRDLDDFPDLLDQMWQGVMVNLYGELTGWLTTECDRGRIAVANPEASAAVLLASLTYYPILDTLIGHTPGDVDADAYADAWVALAATSLGLDHPDDH